MNYGNDIGYLGNRQGSTAVSTGERRSQVYLLTHTDDGLRTSYTNRAFISFSFGGKVIEDWNLIVTTDSNMLNRQLVSDFHDLTTNYDVINGQFYWGTYFDANKISFVLATDGTTQEQLDEFIEWFAPGQTRELILSEYPNRAIMARVSEPLTMDVVPFEELSTVTINGTDYETTTTIYKGSIQINLVMDEPFWYSKLNLLTQIKQSSSVDALNSKDMVVATSPYVMNGLTFIFDDENAPEIEVNTQINDGEYWADIWTDANNNTVSVFESKDALRMIREDRIPTLSMLKDPVFLGNNLVFQRNSDGAVVGSAIVDDAQVGNSASHTQIGNAVTLPNTQAAYLYYAGTAMEIPSIGFYYSPGTGSKIAWANHEFYLTLFSSNNFLNMYLQSDKIQTITFKAPEIYESYNKAMQIFNSYSSNQNQEATRKLIRDNVYHTAVRKWAFKIIDYVTQLYPSVYNSSIKLKMLNAMAYFFGNSDEMNHYFSFNFKTGSMVGRFNYKTLPDTLPILTNLDNYDTIGTLQEFEEDISDMLYSEPPKLDVRNHFSSNGTIAYQTNSDPTLTYKLTHDFPNDLKNLTITYKYLYY